MSTLDIFAVFCLQNEAAWTRRRLLPFWRQGAERSQSGIGGDDDDVSHILVACIIYPPLVVRRRIIGSIETNTLVSTQFLKLPRLDYFSGRVVGFAFKSSLGRKY